MHIIFDLTVEHVFASVAGEVVHVEVLEARVAIDVIDESVAEDVVDSDLLESRVEVVTIDDEIVPTRLEYAPLGALIAIKFNIPCCRTAQLKSTSSATPSPLAKQSQPAYWP